MPQLLIRNIPQETKDALRIAAARNGRSQQAEALVILQDHFRSEPVSMVQMIREKALEAGGIDFEQPPRHPARDSAAL